MQGQFSKEEADETLKSMKEVMDAFPKKRTMEFIGHFNDIFLFLEAAKRSAPAEADIPKT